MDYNSTFHVAACEPLKHFILMDAPLYFINAPPAATSTCPLKPVLSTLLDEVKVLRHEVETLHRMLENEKPKAKKSPKGTVGRLSVDLLMLTLQIKYPEKVWTSDSFAKEIGCTGAAVRQTQAWKDYQKRLQNDKQKHRPRKGYRDQWGNIDAFDTGNGDDFCG